MEKDIWCDGNCNNPENDAHFYDDGNNRISLIDLWDVQFEAEKKYNISDYQSQKLTNEIFEYLNKITKG